MPAHAVLQARGTLIFDRTGVVEVIDTFDRPGKTFAHKTYAKTLKFADGLEDKPGKCLPKAGVHAEAGLGHARAEWSIFEAEAKGPNACAGVGVSMVAAKAYAKAELASASASAGPLKAKVGIAADTGVSISPSGLEVTLLGTGISIGPRIGFQLAGSGLEFNLL